MAIFSKLSSKSARTVHRVSAIAAKAKAKARPHLPRGATVVSSIRVSFAVATALGLSVPYMQGIADAAKQVMACADAIKTNRKECETIATLVGELLSGLAAAAEGVEEEDLDDRARMNLAELEWKLERIGKAMDQRRKESFIRRLLSKDEHAAQLVEHRQTLQSAITKFQIMQLTHMNLGVSRIEKKQETVLNALLLHGRRVRCNVAVIRPNLIFF